MQEIPGNTDHVTQYVNVTRKDEDILSDDTECNDVQDVQNVTQCVSYEDEDVLSDDEEEREGFGLTFHCHDNV